MRNKKEIEAAIKEPQFRWLGRKTFIKDFSKYILSQSESTHICINGVWGSGKTTTILGIIDFLTKEDEIEEKPLILYLDTWKFEHYEHPLFLLLKVMEESAEEIMNSIKGDIEKMSFEPQLGLNVPLFSISISPKNSSPQNQVLNYAEYVDVLNKMMLKAVKKYKEEKGNKLIIFVDELDRVKPEFALKTLEMFHHLQDELPTHIVYTIDMGQLNSIIKHYYGYEYNVEVFVHKVFDVIIPLKKISRREIKDFIQNNLASKMVKYDINSLSNFMLQYMNIAQTESLRTINRICQKITENLGKGYFLKDQYGYSNTNYYLGEFKYDVLWGYVELLVALEILTLTDPISVRKILNGNNINILADFLLESKIENKDSYLWNLIRYSFYSDNDNLKDVKEIDMNREHLIIGLRKIFVSQTKEYTYNSVFSDVDL